MLMKGLKKTYKKEEVLDLAKEQLVVEILILPLQIHYGEVR